MAGLRLPVESHILQAFVTEPIKPIVDHVVSWGAELFYLSQSDKGGLVFGGHIDGFNTYTQRGQFNRIQTVAECAVSLMPFISRLRLAAPLGRHPGHDAGWQPLHLPHAGEEPLSRTAAGAIRVSRRHPPRAGPSPTPSPMTRNMS